MQINCIHSLFCGPSLKFLVLINFEIIFGGLLQKCQCGVTVKTLYQKCILFKKGEILNKTPDQLVWHNRTLVLFNSKWSTIVLNIIINLGNYGSQVKFLVCQGILLIFCKEYILQLQYFAMAFNEPFC